MRDRGVGDVKGGKPYPFAREGTLDASRGGVTGVVRRSGARRRA